MTRMTGDAHGLVGGVERAMSMSQRVDFHPGRNVAAGGYDGQRRNAGAYASVPGREMPAGRMARRGHHARAHAAVGAFCVYRRNIPIGGVPTAS